jgi:hypothetical protein
MFTADIRIIVNTKEEAERVVRELKDKHGARMTLHTPYPGRDGGFLIRGTLVMDDGPTLEERRAAYPYYLPPGVEPPAGPPAPLPPLAPLPEGFIGDGKLAEEIGAPDYGPSLLGESYRPRHGGHRGGPGSVLRTARPTHRP